MTTEPTWTRWYDQRPTDHKALYRWRVSERQILGLPLRPEWSGKLQLCGMGYSDNEYWPPGSYWDGYQRTVDETLEWRLATDAEPEGNIFWGGLGLLPCPFTRKAPEVTCFGSRPYRPEWLSISSWLVKSSGWSDAAKMRDAWNKRAPDDPFVYKEALHQLVSLRTEAEMIHGGGPGWADRWRKAWMDAEDLVRVEP